jgi:hypothetical protein
VFAKAQQNSLLAPERIFPTYIIRTIVMSRQKSERMKTSPRDPENVRETSQYYGGYARIPKASRSVEFRAIIQISWET